MNALLLLLFAAPAAQPAEVAATATPVPATRTTIWLHEREGLRVRLAVVGTAPLRVELPGTLLDAESELKWSIRPAAPPSLKALGDGREEWAQEFQLGAFAYGTAVRVGFAPVKVKAGSEPERNVTAPAFEVRVRSRYDGEDGQEKRDPEKARTQVTVTGIEELPPRPDNAPSPMAWVIVVVAAWVVAVGVVVGLLRRAARKPRPLPPLEWAVAELDRLAGDSTTGGQLAERLAVVLREFVARRFGIPAPKLTTGELLVEAARAEQLADSTAVLGELLERCDRAKFAGDAPDAEEAAEMVKRGREWVASFVPSATPVGSPLTGS